MFLVHGKAPFLGLQKPLGFSGNAIRTLSGWLMGLLYLQLNASCSNQRHGETALDGLGVRVGQFERLGDTLHLGLAFLEVVV